MQKQLKRSRSQLKDLTGSWRGSLLGAPILGLVTIGLLTQPVGAQPNPLSGGGFEFLFKEAAYSPGNEPPPPLSDGYWLKAIITNATGAPVGVNRVQVSLQANLKAVPEASIESVAFNLNPFAVGSNLQCLAADPGICGGAPVANTTPGSWGYTFASNAVDLPNGADGFDFEVLLAKSESANRLTGTDVFTFTVDGLTVDAFNDVNEGKPNSIKGLFSAAKIQGYGGSATLLDGPGTDVPGPLPILGAAAAFQASRRLRRRLKPAAVVAPRSV